MRDRARHPERSPALFLFAQFLRGARTQSKDLSSICHPEPSRVFAAGVRDLLLFLLLTAWSFRAECPAPSLLREAPGHAVEESLFDVTSTSALASSQRLSFDPHAWHIQQPPQSSRNIRAETGVSLDMPKCWRIVLPVIGLMLFGAVTYHSWRVDQEIQHSHTPGRYFYWSGIRLDSDPANKKNLDDGSVMWVDPAWLDEFMELSALPAFLLGELAVHGLAKLGISEVSSFMVLMPLLISSWYFLLGWLLDHWIRKRSQQRAPTGP